VEYHLIAVADSPSKISPTCYNRIWLMQRCDLLVHVDAGFTSKCYAVLGTCGSFEERQVGAERFNHFVDCPEAKSATMVLRGGSEQFIDEVERSLHDAIMIVRRAFKNSDIVAGGGAVDMELSRALRQHARTMTSKGQIFVNSYAKALEVIPRQLCNNAGFDANDVLNKLRQKHHFNNAQFGVDVSTGGVVNTFEAFVWEPKLVKLNALQSATEAACLVLSVDETVQNPASAPPDGGPVMPGRGAGRGRGMGRGRMRR
jgi:T-complex protein 1 subunit eta